MCTFYMIAFNLLLGIVLGLAVVFIPYILDRD